MYFSKIISVTLLAALANAAATPPVLETRQSSACNQVSSALEQTIQYYKARQGQWNGNDALKNAVTELESEASKVKQSCAKLVQIENAQSQTYSGAESQLSDKFS